jgi:hypothetical protein
MKHLDAYTFTSPEDMDKFQITTDKVLGGNTTCSFVMKPYAHFASGKCSSSSHRNTRTEDLSLSTAGLFQGVIDYVDENPQTKGGFAAFRTKPNERTRDLTDFEAIEMRIKTDGRPYVE